QPRRQVEITDAIRLSRRQAGGISFDAEEELATHEDGAEGCLNPRVEIRLAPRIAIERQHALDVRIFHWPPISAAHDRREDLFGTCFFVVGRLGLRDEKEPTAWRVSRSLVVERAGDGDLIDRGREPRV